MNPPVLAEALIAAVAPRCDYESVSGDLHEEYLRVLSLRGAGAANRWYWAQALLSLPSLLSYSRTNRSALDRIGVTLIALAVLVTMLVVLTLLQVASQALFGSVHQIPDWMWLCIDYADAAAFGAVLAGLVRTDGLRVAFLASLFLVLCFVIPAVAGNPHSQAPVAAWIVLCGVIPAMCLGAGLYQAIRSRIGSVN